MSSSTPPTPPPAGRERRFDDREVGLIIHRAAELQRTTDSASAEKGGMSLAELEQVAREAGLDPALVRRAAREIDTPPPPRASRLAGAPLRIVLERTFDGELSTDEYESLVAEIRRTVDDHGQVSVLGRTLSWTAGAAAMGRHRRPRQLVISVTPRHGCTTLRMEESFTHLAGGLFGGLMGGLGGGGGGMAMGIGMGVLHSAAAATGIWGGLILASYGGARGIFSLVVRRRRRQLELLCERLSEGIQRALG